MSQQAARKLNQQPQQSANVKFQKKHIKGETIVSRYLVPDTFLFVTVLAVSVALAIWTVCLSAQLTSAQSSLQAVTQKMSQLHEKNVTTSQTVSELSSRARLEKIAKKAGLSMKENSTRNVTK
ncbi:hypothetical protein L1O48_04790 [Ligilactobacillus equi]|uniref:hypothetical protein n=1 Tax=Ligilactobacillus equi TaxID=137357 RepID=UPI002ED1F305